MAEDAQTEKLKVFVSYSRADVAFADQLVCMLQERGFDPIIDRRDIDPAEPWKERLGAKIKCWQDMGALSIPRPSPRMACPSSPPSWDNTARVWEVSALLSDASRTFAEKKNDANELAPIKEEACTILQATAFIDTDPETGETVTRYPLAEISEADIRAAPILSSIGVKAGDNVCEISAPGPVDRFLSGVLPKTWWSGLEYQ